MNMKREYSRDKPRCFEDTYQYVQWLDAEFVSNGGKNVLSVCVDCTAEFAEKMREEGRCEHPERKFNEKGEPLFDAISVASGYRGVSWHKRVKKWAAKKAFGKVQIHLGYFDDPKKAHEAWEEATNRGPAYYGIAYGIVSEETQRRGLLVRSDGAECVAPRDQLQKRSIWILRHPSAEGVRHISYSNNQPRKPKRPCQEDNGP
jgi:hypothetical protein